MKRYLLTAFFLVGTAICGIAQSSQEMAATIEKALSGNSDITSAFTEKRTPKTGESVSLDGCLTFKAPDYLLMDYSNGEKFLIEGGKITIKKGGKEQVLDAQKNLMMKGLVSALTCAFQGKLTQLSQNQDATMTATREGSQYKVDFTANKKAAKGYSKMTVIYSASPCKIRSMRLEEFTGLVTEYYCQ